MAVGVTVAGLAVPGAAAADDLGAIGCILRAREQAALGAASRGLIAHIDVDRSDRVEKGQVLAELEASQEESAVALAQMKRDNDIAVRLARAKAETAEVNAQRLTTLVEHNLAKAAEQEQAVLAAQTARLEEEQALYELEQAKVELAAAEAARERKRVRAPFDGVVTERRMAAGEIYTEQEPILVIAAIDPLHVEAYLPATERGRVALGQVLSVTLDDGATMDATVDVIDPLLDAATGTFGIRLALPNPDGAILAGQGCRLAD